MFVYIVLCYNVLSTFTGAARVYSSVYLTRGSAACSCLRCVCFPLAIIDAKESLKFHFVMKKLSAIESYHMQTKFFVTKGYMFFSGFL